MPWTGNPPVTSAATTAHPISRPWRRLSSSSFPPSRATASAPSTPTMATTNAARRMELTALAVTGVVAKASTRRRDEARRGEDRAADPPEHVRAQQVAQQRREDESAGRDHPGDQRNVMHAAGRPAEDDAQNGLPTHDARPRPELDERALSPTRLDGDLDPWSQILHSRRSRSRGRPARRSRRGMSVRVPRRTASRRARRAAGPSEPQSGCPSRRSCDVGT